VAYSSGDIGWGAARVRESFEDGNEVDKRVTAVFVIERGHWRVGHWHVSVGVSNEHSVGRPLTTSIDRLEKSVRGTRPDLREASAPDGTVTLLFSDIESSSTLLDRLGDAGFLELLAWHDGVIRDTSAEHRGFVVKSQGDGFMIAFPSATFALRCALTIQERLEKGFDRTNVRARIGLHAGETMHHAGDFYGRTVVIAARIGALAVGGEVLASDLVYALAGGLGTFRFSEPRPVTLKGLAGEFVVYRVLN
jgi:class 3 adenylate cyclase